MSSDITQEQRIESIYGTWTIDLKLETDIWGYSAEFYVITHILCDDQLKGNKCSLDNCDSQLGKVCLKDGNSSKYCGDMKELTIDWSDIVLYYYMGYKVKGGGYDEDKSTEEWIGPYNSILEENKVDESIIDSYKLKYVNGPSLPYAISKPKECELFDHDAFLNYFGPAAINTSVNIQALNMTLDEAFEPYYKTCDNGSVQPAMPMFRFDFIPDKDGEMINVHIDYKLFLIPNEDDSLYDILPKLQKQGLPISGPFCYEGDPNRAYSLDIDGDSTDSNLFTLYHSGVKGLPYTPDSVEKCGCYNGEDLVEGSSTTLRVGTLFYLVISTIVLSILLFFSLVANYYHYKIQKKISSQDSATLTTASTSSFLEKFDDSCEPPTLDCDSEEKHDSSEPILNNESNTEFFDSGGNHDLSQPLLSKEN